MAIIYNPVVIQESGSQPAVAEEKKIFLYDYDGTLVESYSFTELDNLSALPPPPTHEGLTFDGWNWTLAQLKSKTDNEYDFVPDEGMVVGALYHTTSNCLEIVIEIYDALPNKTVTLDSYFNSANIEINWGDGSTTTGTTNTHTYSANGSYTIKIGQASGGDNSYLQGVPYMFGQTSTPATFTEYNYYAKSVRLPSNYNLCESQFRNCGFLESVSMPANIVFHNYTTQYTDGRFCFACGTTNYSKGKLKFFVFPQSVTDIPPSILAFCGGLENVSFSPFVKTVNSYAFQYCQSLRKALLSNILLRSSESMVKFLLGSYSFQYCYFLSDISITYKTAIYNQSEVSSIALLPTDKIEIGSNCYASCTALKKIKLNVTNLGSTAAALFTNCYSLSYVELNNLSIWYFNIFSNCYSIKTLIISTPTFTSNDNGLTIGNSALNNCKLIELFKISSNKVIFSTSSGANGGSFGAANIKTFDFTGLGTNYPTTTSGYSYVTDSNGGGCFGTLMPDTKILVSDDSWKNRTINNWNMLAKYMEVVP